MAKVKEKIGYHTDRIMGRVYAALVSDLSTSAGLEDKRYNSVHSVVAECEKLGDYARLRELTITMPEPDFNGPRYSFKARYQIKNYLKRYSFSKDLYSLTDLTKSTNAKFLELQESLARPRAAYKQSTEVVLKRARQIVKSVLGPYDRDEHYSSCRFSTKACVGFPTTRSYLHVKAEGPLTGSYGHLRWLKDYCATDELFCRAFSSETQEIDALNLINVPKSYKTLRGIFPNTLIGSFHSYGLGVMIQKRLEKVRIDISRQPELHKQVAKQESKKQSLVTADLSNASNCFTSVLVRKLVPREWYRHFDLGRLQTISIEGKRYHMASFMGMGIGFTFTLQTLLFYAIIAAIQELLGRRGFISVFGDDLIYHRRLHPYVVSVLSDCGFALNHDKTFVSVPFRESCGGDFFKSLDVRPANPEGVGAVLGKWKYLAFLHKIVNGLTLRWSEYDLPSTIHLLKRELLRIGGPIFSIPEDLPDYAGVKRITCNWYEPINPPVYSTKTQCYMFSCLVESPNLVPVPTLIAYYWDTLRSNEDGSPSAQTDKDLCWDSSHPGTIWRTVRDKIAYKPASPNQQPKNYRSRITRCRLKLLIPHVAEKGGRNSILRVHQAISILAS